MIKKRIKLGYRTETGEEIDIVPSHLIVTGITQLSGKTTTLEALIKRSGLKAIVFKTKIGEKSFTQGTEIPPFFRDRSDYEFVKSLIEAYAKEKLFLEKGTLMKLCKGSVSLIEIKKRVDEALTGKLRGIQEEIYTRLQHYLENLIPQIQYQNLSKVLTTYEGINIMNLERFSEEAQSLIIQSVADEVLNTMKDTILVIPEAWKFIPQKYNNPCKRVVESFIRQGASNHNFIWIDSQDMAGVDKIPLKQVSTWILGYQAERNEVKHTLDQISLPKKSKPKEDEIMTLRKGHFFLSSYDGVEKVYVQPVWLTDEEAIKVAKGETDVEDISPPDNLIPLSFAPAQKKEGLEIRFDDSKVRKQINELRIDFFNKIQELQTAIQKAFEEIYNLKTEKKDINADEIVGLVLQKMPSSNGTINTEEIIQKVLAKVPKTSGNVVYEVAPLEKLKKDFLENGKQIILREINALSQKGREILKWIEANGKQTSRSEIVRKLWNYTTPSNQNEDFKTLESKSMVRRDNAGRLYPNLREYIKSFLANYEPTEQDIEGLYNHILMEMIK
jgi:hypothetical protein